MNKLRLKQNRITERNLTHNGLGGSGISNIVINNDSYYSNEKIGLGWVRPYNHINKSHLIERIIKHSGLGSYGSMFNLDKSYGLAQKLK